MAKRSGVSAWLAAGAFAILAACSQQAPTSPDAAEAAEAPTAAVAAAVAQQRERFAAAPAPSAADQNTAYQFSFDGLSTPSVPMTAFRGEVVLVVNTASKCGFTPQYEGLQQLYTELHAQGFEVLGVPSNDFGGQEPGSAQEIREFCSLNFGVTFPMAGKVDVVGDSAHPFYQWAHSTLGDAAVPRWNFHKILVGRDGRLITAFPSATTPTSAEVRAAVNTALAAGH